MVELVGLAISLSVAMLFLLVWNTMWWNWYKIGPAKFTDLLYYDRTDGGRENEGLRQKGLWQRETGKDTGWGRWGWLATGTNQTATVDFDTEEWCWILCKRTAVTYKVTLQSITNPIIYLLLFIFKLGNIYSALIILQKQGLPGTNQHCSFLDP